MSDKFSTENFMSSMKGDEQIDLGKIFRFLLMQSKLIISVVFVTLIASYVNYSFSTKQYMMQSLLQYESFNQNIFDPSDSLQMGSYGSSSDFSNLTALYESRTNFLKVIRDLKLNINIQGLDDDENIDIMILSDERNEFKRHKLNFSFTDSNYSLLDEKLNKIQTADYGEEINFNKLRININSSDLKENRNIEIYFRHAESMYNSLKTQIKVETNSARNSWYKSDGLITISYVSDNIDLGKEIINYANDIFLNQRIFVETEKSRKAIDFIDKNISSFKEVVDTNKIKLKEFREKNKSIDVSLEIEAIINKIESLDKSLSEIDIEITKSQEIYTSNNPVYLNLLNKKNLIERQKEEVLSEIEMMPKEQQEYIDLYNDLEVYQALYEELESRRLGFSILEASTIGDIRIVDEAYVASLVAPRLIYVFYTTFFSLVIICLIAVVRGFYFMPLSNPAEIFDNNISVPVIGVIPQVDDIQSDEDIRLNSSIESLIININSINKDSHENNLITITSPTPFNGKSTISMKLAEGLSKIDNKVLLVDNDLKRGKIDRSYNIRSISERRFNSIDESTINKYMINENFYVIPRVKGLNNTFQFLYNYNYKDKIKFFKDHFDYVIFDTGPILSVADSSILIEQSDVNILIARHGISKINEIKQAVDNFKQINTNIDGIVYNAYAKPSSYYGYYGVYGNYSYQYYAEKYLDDAYDYIKED